MAVSRPRLGYEVERLEARPGQRLSYQTHAHRAELWVIVAGVATCVIEGRTLVAREGDVEVGVGVAHRITNLHHQDLAILEGRLRPGNASLLVDAG